MGSSILFGGAGPISICEISTVVNRKRLKVYMQAGICLIHVAPICGVRGWRKNTPELTELEAKFGAEEAYRAYLAQLRWPAGFRCPRCGSGKDGTIFQDTLTPLTARWAGPEH